MWRRGVSVQSNVLPWGSLCCDGEVFAVAFHDGAIGYQAFVVESVSVDEQQLGCNCQLCDSKVHGMDGSPKDVGLVYLLRRYGGYSPGNGVFFYLVPQLLKLVGGDPVSVVPDQDNDRIIPVGDIDLNMQLAAGIAFGTSSFLLGSMKRKVLQHAKGMA